MSKLLLIDDEEDVRYSLQRIFDGPDVELATAASGEEGLKVIPKFKPDLVLMDVRMGGMTGLETLRKIRASDPKLLVILMTAYGTTQTAIEAMKLGAYDYLLKPFDIAKLKEVISNAFKAARGITEGTRFHPFYRIYLNRFAFSFNPDRLQRGDIEDASDMLMRVTRDQNSAGRR